MTPMTAQELRAIRSKLGLTQDGLAQEMGMGKSTIASYETAENFPSARPIPKSFMLALEGLAQRQGINIVALK